MSSVKINYGDEIRRVVFEKEYFSFEELHQNTWKLFPQLKGKYF